MIALQLAATSVLVIALCIIWCKIYAGMMTLEQKAQLHFQNILPTAMWIPLIGLVLGIIVFVGSIGLWIWL